jgi:hypothetical protein
LERDRVGLGRFVDRLGRESAHSWRVLFTPWGEALVRQWYRRAVTQLTHFDHVESVGVQTNLSSPLDWIDDCRPGRLTLWATYHPTEVSRERFLSQVSQLRARSVRVSVGMVGAVVAVNEIQNMRRHLPDDVYLWINAQQPRPRPYTADEETFFAAIDPQFLATYRRRPSLGAACPTGESSFTVDGDGGMRRCHFVDETIGNFYEDQWMTALRPRPCPNRFCDCFLGKSQLQADDFRSFFGIGLLERAPTVKAGF